LTCLLLNVGNAFAVNTYAVLFDTAEFKCLVKNIYYEARGEPVKGQEAVALVTINRAKHPDYPSSICATVYQKYQFSWTANRTLSIKDREAWKRAENVAYHVLLGTHSLGQFKALNFHATYVNPGWGKPRVAKIGNHIFY
jgi:spore germination cell wall hydrolase CwlJ-like protein